MSRKCRTNTCAHAERPGLKVVSRAFLKSLALLPALLIMLLTALPASANDDNPTLAFLRFGASPTFALTDAAVMDMLEAYGYINADERVTLENGDDLHGENINILIRDAGFDFPTANLMVEDALDEGADIMLTVSTQVGMLAVGAMSDMDDPPALIFAIVTDPHGAGLASATCIKPANVTGTLMHIDYEEYASLAYKQDPDFQTIGLLASADDPATPYYVATIEHTGEQLGFTVEVATVVTAADYALATEALVDKDVDIITLPPRTGSSGGISSIVDAAIGVPVFSPLVSDVIHGVTIAAGFEGWYREGVQAGRMLVAYLEGRLDIAATGVASTPSFAVAVNLDSADAQGVVFTDALMAEVDYIIEGGVGQGAAIEIPGELSLSEMTLDERRAEDDAWLQSLHCTPEMIAEQQAQLDAQSN